MGRVLGRPVLKMLGIDFQIEGKEILVENRPGIFISNHQDNIDLFCCGAIIPKRTVSLGKKSLRWIPFFGQMYWLTGNVLIDRAHKKRAYGTMDKAVEAVTEKDTTIWMMPEGTRNRVGGVAPFKKGVFYAAIKSRRPLTPICFNRYSEHINLNKIKSGKIRMKVLSPIDTTKWKEDQAGELAEHCHDLVSQCLKEMPN
jgi:1-acyl-sn-glycerol-3-phosphate acyltransferase